MRALALFLKKNVPLEDLIEYCSWAIASALLVLIVYVVAGQRYTGLFTFFGTEGLYTERRGVYIDCELPENQKSAFCQPKGDDSDSSTWRTLRGKGKPLSFSLYED